MNKWWSVVGIQGNVLLLGECEGPLYDRVWQGAVAVGDKGSVAHGGHTRKCSVAWRM